MHLPLSTLGPKKVVFNDGYKRLKRRILGGRVPFNTILDVQMMMQRTPRGGCLDVLNRYSDDDAEDTQDRIRMFELSRIGKLLTLRTGNWLLTKIPKLSSKSLKM